MSKLTRTPMYLTAALALLALHVPIRASVILTPGTWYSESSLNAGVGIATGTNSITLTNSGGNTARIGGVSQLNQSVTLDDVGDFIQFVGDYSGSVGNNVNYSIRVGFFNSTGLNIDTNFDADMDSLIGYHGDVGTRSTAGAATAVVRQPLNTSSYVLSLESATPTANGASLLGSAVTPISTGNRTITFRMERVVGDILEFSLSDGVNINITRTQAIASAVTLNYDTVAVGFILANNGSATFSNIAITTIPEPASLALFGVGSLLIGWRKRTIVGA